jgi:hypothetical protein
VLAPLPLARLGFRSPDRQARRAATTTASRPTRSRARRRRLRRCRGGPSRTVRTVTDVMAETMVAWGVTTHVFGMVGHSNLGLADALRRRCDAGEMRYIGIRHEGAAAFAAAPTASSPADPRPASPSPVPARPTCSPGCWDAKVDRAPVLALTGQVNTQVLGPGAFQEIDLATRSRGRRSARPCFPASNHAELMSTWPARRDRGPRTSRT